MAKPNIDWSKHDEKDVAECHCYCGAVYGSHAKAVSEGTKFTVFSRTPCPACGSNSSLRKVSYSTETYGIGG